MFRVCEGCSLRVFRFVGSSVSALKKLKGAADDINPALPIIRNIPAFP